MKSQLAWIALQKTITEQVVPALMPFINNITKILKWLDKLNPKLRTLVVVFALAAGPLLVLTSNIALLSLALLEAGVAAGTFGTILLGVTGVGAVIAIGAALFIAYKRVKWFHNAVDAVTRFIKHHWVGIVTYFMPFIGLTIQIYKHWKQVQHVLSGVWNTIRKITSVPGKVGGWIHKRVPGLAGGGSIYPGGSAFVGEQGMELASNIGGVTKVTPLNAGALVGAGGPIIVHSHLHVGKRELAEAVGEAVRDRKARR